MLRRDVGTAEGTTPRVALGAIAALLVLQVGMSCFVNLWLFPSRWLDPIARGTAGLVDATLAANLLTLAVVLGALLWWTRLAPAHLGLTRRGIGVAATVGVVAWLVAQVPAIAGAVLSDRSLHLADAWLDGSATWTIGALLAQLAGNALYEEAFFRGFLLVQVALAFGAIDGPHGRAWRWTGAVAVSQLVFAATHVPNRLAFAAHDSFGAWAADLSALFAAGATFALIYVGFGNLWLAVVLHALLNRPTALFAGEGAAPRAAVAAVTLAVAIAAAVRAWRGSSRPSSAP